VNWRTNLAETDGLYNWQLSRFDIPASALVDARNVQLAWIGHGEPTAGYPTELYLWDFDASSWVLIGQYTGGSVVGLAGTYRRPASEQFCVTCHRASPPVGATGAAAFVNIADSWAWDRHGEASGSGSGGSIKAPFARGAAAIPCETCHDSHGSSNIYHLKPTLNGSAGVTVNNSAQYRNACAACHTGTVADWHYGECNSCHWTADHASGRTIDESYDCAECHKHGGTWAHPNPGCHGCNDPSGASWRTF
jgi:hypothetical protein